MRLLTVCGWCNRPLSTDFMPDAISHGLCAACRERALVEVGAQDDPSVWDWWRDVGGEG